MSYNEVRSYLSPGDLNDLIVKLVWLVSTTAEPPPQKIVIG
jgi:hypothetical protein